MSKELLCYALMQMTVSALIAGHEEFRKKLETRVPEYTVSERSRLWALLRVAKEFEVPMGIEWVHRSGPENSINQTWHDRSVLGIVTDLAGVEGHGIEVREEIVQIFSDPVRAAKWNFLNLVLGRFEANNEMLAMVNARLYYRLRGMIEPPKPTEPGGIGGSIGIGASGKRLVTLHLENSSFREILSRLVVSAGAHSWVVIFPDKPEVMPNGFARALQLYGLDLPPDDRQPVYVLVPWDFQPPSRRSVGVR